MFKATHKRRATTLSKTLLTAGLLGGATLSTLSAGSAQAVWTPHPSVPSNSYSCNFQSPNAPGGDPGCKVNEPSGVVIDKVLTLLDWTSIPVGSDLEFSYQPADLFTPWHVDLDFNPDDSNGGSLVYKIEIVPSSLSSLMEFSKVNFISARDQDTSLTKTYGTGWDGTNITGPIDILSLTNNVADNGPAFGKVLYVKDVWNGPGAIDNLSNEFNQQVPAPLPLLGVGAAFGSIRKLRKFSSQLKTFSMG